MNHSTSKTTADELLAMPDDGNRYELVEGALRMMSPAGGRHGRVAMNLAFLIRKFVEKHPFGVVFAAATGFLLARNPDTVRAPDVAFVSASRLGDLVDETGYLPLAPDFVAEVLSPNDRPSEVEAKVKDWLTAGVQAVLVVDPQTRCVHCHRSDDDVQTVTAGTVDLTPVFPGLRLLLSDLFA